MKVPKLKNLFQIDNGVFKAFIIINLVYFSRIGKNNFGLAFPFLFLFFLSFLLGKKDFKSPLLWIGLSLVLVLKLYQDFYAQANHHFLLLFTNLVILQSTFYPLERQNEFLAKNAKILLMIVFFFASLHKFSSTSFVNGSYFSYMFMHGEFFTPIPEIHPEYASWVKENKKIYSDLTINDPHQKLCVDFPLENKDFLFNLSKKFSFLVLFMEFLAFIMLFFVKNDKIVHLSVLSLVIGILLTRPECGFLSIICGLGFICCPNKLKNIKTTYLVLIAFFSALIMLKLALH